MNTRGRPRRVTEEQERQIKNWKPLKQLARELGVTHRAMRMIRDGYVFKRQISR